MLIGGVVPRASGSLHAATHGFAHWLRTHRGATIMAGLLSLAVPVTLFPGAMSVMRQPSLLDVLELTGWFVLLGGELWVLLLIIGYALAPFPARSRAVNAAALLGACAAAGVAEFSNGRGRILLEQGVVDSVMTMHVYAFAFALIMALLFFAHLHRSRAREEAARRLGAAQSAQRQTRQRLVQARLQAVQARIDPQLLFEMLEEVRSAYEQDASRAERLLDELVAFLRIALPRLRNPSSNVEREALLAGSYAQLRTVAGACEIDLRVDVSADVSRSRFPPGILLPLLDDTVRAGRARCDLVARRCGSHSQVTLGVPDVPSDATIARLRELLIELYGSAAELSVTSADGVTTAIVKVPYELA